MSAAPTRVSTSPSLAFAPGIPQDWDERTRSGQGGEDLDASTAAMLLGRVEPFRGLDEWARLTVVEHAGRRVVDKGQVVFWQDDPGEAMFVLLEGSVKLVVCSRDGELIELHRHDAPAIFGELALLDAGPRSASAEAVERSTLLVVTRPELLRLLRSDEQVAEALLRTLGAMVRRTTRQISDLAFLSLQGRVAAKLLDWPSPAGPGPGGSPRSSWPPWSAGPGRR